MKLHIICLVVLSIICVRADESEDRKLLENSAIYVPNVPKENIKPLPVDPAIPNYNYPYLPQYPYSYFQYGNQYLSNPYHQYLRSQQYLNPVLPQNPVVPPSQYPAVQYPAVQYPAVQYPVNPLYQLYAQYYQNILRQYPNAYYKPLIGKPVEPVNEPVSDDDCGPCVEEGDEISP